MAPAAEVSDVAPPVPLSPRVGDRRCKAFLLFVACGPVLVPTQGDEGTHVHDEASVGTGIRQGRPNQTIKDDVPDGKHPVLLRGDMPVRHDEQNHLACQLV